MPLSLLIGDFQILLLMTIRILVMLSFTPIVSASHTPFFVRVVLAAVVAYMIRYVMGISVPYVIDNLGVFVVFLVGEAMIGAIIGFYIQMVFMFLNEISEFFSTFMGLRAVQVLNPLTGVSSAVITQFISIIVMFVFMSSYSLQKVFYYGISQSFLALNAYSIFSTSEESFLGFIFYNFARLFEKAFIIALPMFISLVLVNIGLGIFAKVAPQINLLVVGLPLQLGVGLVFLFLFLPVLVRGFEVSFEYMFSYITSLIRRLAI